MERAPLTDRQAAVLDFLRSREAAGLPASVRDVQDEFRIHSTNGAYCHLVALKKKGYLQSNTVGSKMMARGLRVVGDSVDAECRELVGLWRGLTPGDRELFLGWVRRRSQGAP